MLTIIPPARLKTIRFYGDKDDYWPIDNLIAVSVEIDEHVNGRTTVKIINADLPTGMDTDEFFFNVLIEYDTPRGQITRRYELMSVYETDNPSIVCNQDISCKVEEWWHRLNKDVIHSEWGYNL